MATKKGKYYEARLTTGYKYNRKTGKNEQIRKPFTAKTEEEAEQRANEYHKKYILGNCEDITFEEYAEKFLGKEELENESVLSPKTKTIYRSNLKIHINPHIGKMRVGDITKKNIKGVLLYMKEEGLGGRSRQIALSVIRQIMQEAVYDEVIEDNIALKVARPVANSKPTKAIKDDDEIKKIIRSAKCYRDKLIYITAVVTGIRRGEVAGLKKTRILFSEDIIQIREGVTTPDTGPVLGKLKNGDKSKRDIKTPKALIVLLKEFCDTNDSEFVFPSDSGGFLDPREITRQFKNVIKELGLDDDYSFRSLRKGSGTIMAEEGVSVKEIQNILGHTTEKTTEKSYIELTLKMQKKAAELERFKDIIES